MDEPDLPYASVGPRAAAALIDAVILGFVAGIPIDILLGHRYSATTASGHTVGYVSTGVLPDLLWLAMGIIYFTIMEKTKGATIGKLILHLRVRRSDGADIDWKAAFVRNLVRVVDGIPFFIPYLTGAVSAWTSPTFQRLGDKAARTVVVYDRGHGRPHAPFRFSPDPK